ncbi:SpoIIE family protein phosphatase [Kineococcus esterisolvens]|uniref:SpoIIE family protein phosphatase n=1 Tax=unclassified Kineococcus TaxID=2621656 RepID=UPI003D7DC441
MDAPTPATGDPVAHRAVRAAVRLLDADTGRLEPPPPGAGRPAAAAALSAVVPAEGPVHGADQLATACRDAAARGTAVRAVGGDPDGVRVLAVPVTGRRGEVLAALGVLAATPRTFDDADATVLAQLAQDVATHLELAAGASSPDPADQLRRQLAIDAARIGSFDWDLTGGEVSWDDRLRELFGFPRARFTGPFEEFTSALHPDDVPRVSDALRRAVETCGDYEAEYRVVRPDGRVRWLKARGAVLTDAAGRASRMLGAAFDTTADHESDARVTRVLETMPSAFFSLDRRWRFTYVNARAEGLLGRSRAEMLGQDVWELFPQAVGAQFETQYRAAVATGRAVEFEEHYPEPLNAWYEVRAWPTPDGLSVYFHDVTARRAAVAEAEQASAAARSAAQRMRVLAGVSEDLTETLDAEEGVARLGQHLVPTLADWCVLTLLDEHGALRDVGSAHVDPAALPLVREYQERRLRALGPGSPLSRARRTGRDVVVPSGAARELCRHLLDERSREVVRELAPESQAVLPLRARGRIVGAVTLFRGAQRATFSPDDLLTASEIADRAALALDNARLYGAQQRIAEGLQRSLLTAPVQPEHLRVAVRYQPAAQAAQVGGDWYDAFHHPGGGTLLVIGDVMGHDVDAAAAMSQARNLLRGVAVTDSGAPGKVLAGLDAAMAVLGLQTTATAVVALLEPALGGAARLRWANAGHLPPLLRAPDGSVRLLEGPVHDLLLGIDAHQVRHEHELLLEPGSTLLLYTDGLVERRDQPVDVGVRLLGDAVAQLPDLDVEEVCDAVLARLVPAGAEDDVALLAVHVRTGT